VDTASAAWAAGLRDGPRLVRREAGVPGDATLPYARRVSDGTREWTVRSLPASPRPVTRQRASAAPGAESDAPGAPACWP
jgi:hypothetical protein